MTIPEVLDTTTGTSTTQQLSAMASEPSSISTPQTFRIGTRRSALAVIQAEHFRDTIKKAHPQHEYEIVAMATMGDKNQVTPLHNFGAKALWTHELEHDLLEGRLDMVVHCVKDMPTQIPTDFEIAWMGNRVDPRDAIVMKKGVHYKTLQELPAGSVVGTSSVRRSAQISRSYPQLKFKDIRGNVGTRLSKLDAEDGEYTCTLLASAGLERLGLGDRVTQLLDSKTPGGGMMYAVGQGALAVEIRAGDKRVTELLAKMAEPQVHLACLAERSLMRTLEGGCSVPIGVETEWIEKGKLLMRSVVCSLDGTEGVESERLGEVTNEKEADEFGWNLAQALVEKGAGHILEAINLNRKVIEAQDGA